MSMSNNQFSKDDKNKGKTVNVYSPYLENPRCVADLYLQIQTQM